MKLNRFPRNNCMYYTMVYNYSYFNNEIIKEEKMFIEEEFKKAEDYLKEVIANNPSLQEKIVIMKQRALERAELWDKARKYVYYDQKRRNPVGIKPNEKLEQKFTTDDLNRLQELEKKFENKTGLSSCEKVKEMMLHGERVQNRPDNKQREPRSINVSYQRGDTR